MKRTYKTRTISRSGTKVILASLAAAMLTFGTTAFATDTPTTKTETDKLINHTISQTSGNITGDLDSYNNPDKNLEIIWNNDSRGNKAAVCDGVVNAKNITINSDYETHASFHWLDKGVISESAGSHLTASENITITSRNDGVYTDSAGKVTIDGF